jgi:hypothetical protein
MRRAAGVGAYYVPPDDGRAVSVLGLHVGGGVAISCWGRGSLESASRLLILPDVNRERLQVVPVELTLRVWWTAHLIRTACILAPEGIMF